MNNLCIEHQLRRLRLRHLSEEEINQYVYVSPKTIGACRVKTHVSLCQICCRRLKLIQEEAVAIASPASVGDSPC